MTTNGRLDSAALSDPVLKGPAQEERGLLFRTAAGHRAYTGGRSFHCLPSS